MKKNQTLFFVAFIGVLAIFSLNALNKMDVTKTAPQEDLTQWQDSYTSAAENSLTDYDDFVADTVYYDYTNPVIAEVADSIASNTDNSREAIEQALYHTYKNVEYVWGEPDNSCFDGAAPDILGSGKGQCDTQSIVVISLLRHMGIAAKPVGGCIVSNPDCRLQSFLSQSFQDIFRVPHFSPLQFVLETEQTFSRGYSREGGLHAFVAAWTPEDGWLTLEATTGKIADTKCYYYHVEIFPEDDEKEDICVSKSFNYAQACQRNDLDTMDQFGIGLMPEVTP